MRNQSVYEWVIEELDEFGDIIDPEYFDSLKSHGKIEVSETMRLALVWEYGNDVDGEQDRAYAYVDPETTKLPEEFENGRAVPQRFHQELYQWRVRTAFA